MIYEWGWLSRMSFSCLTFPFCSSGQPLGLQWKERACGWKLFSLRSEEKRKKWKMSNKFLEYKLNIVGGCAFIYNSPCLSLWHLLSMPKRCTHKKGSPTMNYHFVGIEVTAGGITYKWAPINNGHRTKHFNLFTELWLGEEKLFFWKKLPALLAAEIP